MHDRKPHIFTSWMADVLKQLKRGSGRGKRKKVRLSHRACNNNYSGLVCCTVVLVEGSCDSDPAV